MIRVGEFSLWIALLSAVWGVSLSIAGGVWRRRELAASGAMGVHVSAAALVLSCAGLASALWQSDFALRYVATFTTANLPGAYRLSALWAGPAGSLLCAATMLGVVASAALVAGRRSHGALSPWVAATLAVLLTFFIGLLLFGPSPFERLPFPPAEGRGLDPQLQNPAMALHPPFLILGYAWSAVPFAFVVAGLAERRLDDAWFGATRRWAIGAWTVLTVGITIGLWWAYREVSWHGYSSWDAVEVAGVLPWFALGALAFAIPPRAAPARRHVMGAVLASLAYLFVLGGAFVARSGAVPSAHAFAWSVAGESFLWLAAVAFALTAALAYRARNAFRSASAADGADGAAVGMPRPRAARLVLLAGAASFLLGLGGAAFNKHYATELGEGASFTARDPFGRAWVFTSQGVSRYQREDRAVISVALRPTLAGRRRAFIKPELRQFLDSEDRELGEPSSKAAVQSTIVEDVYVVLDDVREAGAKLEIGFRPLVSLIWIGGALMALGGLITLAVEPAAPANPPDEEEPVPVPRDVDREAEAAIARWRARRTTCRNCGADAEDDAIFCSACGLSLEDL